LETVADYANGNNQAVGGNMRAIGDSDASLNCGVIINSNLYTEICMTPILVLLNSSPNFTSGAT